jgi:flavodoxin
MRILVTYFSQTGNTRQIAVAIHTEMAKQHDCELIALEQILPEDLKKYNMIVVGSPIHAGGLAAQVKAFLDSLPDDPGFAMAAFITHAASVYDTAGFDKGVKAFETAADQKRIQFKGLFSCQGRLTPELHDFVKASKKLSDGEWEKRKAEFNRHPNAEDEERAAVFARTIIEEAS